MQKKRALAASRDPDNIVTIKRSPSRVFYSNDFSGHYPVGASAIVRAGSEEQARQMLTDALAEQGLTFDGTLTEFRGYGVVILQNGDY